MKNRLEVNSEFNEFVNPKKRIFRLGEYHYESPEFIDDKGIMRHYPKRVLKEATIFLTLSEAYKKTDTSFLDQMLIDISEALQKYDTKEVNNLTIGNFGIYVQDGEYVQLAVYNPMTKKINIFINRKCLEHIKAYQNIPNILKRIKAAYVHENTHMQQDAASNGKFYNSNTYKSADINKPESVKDYLNQRVELDAYARQYGFELRELYPNESTEGIFKRVFNAEIDDEDLKNNLIAIFDTLTDKNKNFFLRNMYDYINGEENWE